MSAEPHRYFWKVIWGPRKSSVVSEIALYREALYRGCSVLDLYKYGCILTQIFSLEEKTDVTSFQETNVSSCLPKIHAFLGQR